MHPNNIHNRSYNFTSLSEIHPDLNDFIFMNGYGNKSIDFADSAAVFSFK